MQNTFNSNQIRVIQLKTRGHQNERHGRIRSSIDSSCARLSAKYETELFTLKALLRPTPTRDRRAPFGEARFQAILALENGTSIPLGIQNEDIECALREQLQQLLPDPTLPKLGSGTAGVSGASQATQDASTNCTTNDIPRNLMQAFNRLEPKDRHNLLVLASSDPLTQIQHALGTHYPEALHRAYDKRKDGERHLDLCAWAQSLPQANLARRVGHAWGARESANLILKQLEPNERVTLVAAGFKAARAINRQSGGR